MAMREDEATELSCVVIPVGGRTLLLPNVCIAEILPWRRIKPLQNGPAWCMGFFGWRGQTVPVLNFAGFDDTPAQAQTASRCMIVMNRARNAQGPAFYALAADALPRMLQLTGEDLQSADGTLQAADVMHVKVGTEAVTIPDLGYLERNVAKLLETVTP